MNSTEGPKRVAVKFTAGVWHHYNPVDQQLVVDALADRMTVEIDAFCRDLNYAKAAAAHGEGVSRDTAQTLWRREHEVSTWGYAIAALGWYVSEMERWEKLREDFHQLGQVVDLRIE